MLPHRRGWLASSGWRLDPIVAQRLWCQPEVTALGRLPMRPPLVPFPDLDQARSHDPERSPWWRSLDGDWKFQLVNRPESAPDGWHQPRFDDRQWRTVTVPGCWTRQDAGDRPHYTNVQMPFGAKHPRSPSTTPPASTGSEFARPADLAGPPDGRAVRRRRELPDASGATAPSSA